MVIWLTGLSGSGKTTIGKALYTLLKMKVNTVLIDGDDVRQIIGDNIGYDAHSRKVNAWRICRFCQYLEKQQLNVICCTVSLFEEIHEWNRNNFKEYFEIYIDVPMDELIRRDQKSIYSETMVGRMKDVMGIDISHTSPSNPEMVIKNHPFECPTKIANDILNNLTLKNLVT